MLTAERRRPTAEREAKLRAMVARPASAPAKKPSFDPKQPVEAPAAFEIKEQPKVEPPIAIMARASEVETILEEMRAALKRRTGTIDGEGALKGLGRNFRLCDRNTDGTLDLDEFAKCISLCKLTVTAEQVATLWKHFDRNASGAIDYNEFLRAVRGRLSPARRKLVVLAFHSLDAMGNGDGVLTIEDLAPLYDTSKHPEVIAGKLDGSSALRVFLDGFEGRGGDRDGTVTLDEWLNYYEEISASIDSDDEFSTLLVGTWGGLKAPGMAKPAISHVSSRDVDALEKILYETTYRRKGGSMHSQEKLLNDAFKLFDANASGQIEPKEFLQAMERFGLHVRGKGRPGIGGLPEAVVMALFERYDKDGSGTLSFREFSSAFVSRNQTAGGSTIPADEYLRPPVQHEKLTEFNDAEMRHPMKKHDPELMGISTSRVVNRGYLANAAKIHGNKSAGKGPGRGAAFK